MQFVESLQLASNSHGFVSDKHFKLLDEPEEPAILFPRWVIRRQKKNIGDFRELFRHVGETGAWWRTRLGGVFIHPGCRADFSVQFDNPGAERGDLEFLLGKPRLEPHQPLLRIAVDDALQK